MEEKTWYEHGKGYLEVIRDGVLLLVFGALLIHPAFIKDRLTKAGFTKGSFAGFEWEAALEKSVEEAKEATATVAALEKELHESRTELTQLRATPNLPPEARDKIARLTTRIDTTTTATSAAKDKLQKSIGAQQTLMRQIQAKR